MNDINNKILCKVTFLKNKIVCSVCKKEIDENEKHIIETIKLIPEFRYGTSITKIYYCIDCYEQIKPYINQDIISVKKKEQE